MIRVCGVPVFLRFGVGRYPGVYLGVMCGILLSLLMDVVTLPVFSPLRLFLYVMVLVSAGVLLLVIIYERCWQDE